MGILKLRQEYNVVNGTFPQAAWLLRLVNQWKSRRVANLGKHRLCWDVRPSPRPLRLT